MSKTKAANSDFRALQSLRYAIQKNKIQYISSVMNICYETMTTILIQIPNSFSSFTSLYLGSQSVTQMCWAVSYTCGFMYQFTLYIAFSFIIFHFAEFIFQRKSLTSSCYLRYQNIPRKSRVFFLGRSWAVVLHAYRTIVSKVVCHSLNSS